MKISYLKDENKITIDGTDCLVFKKVNLGAFEIENDDKQKTLSIIVSNWNITNVNAFKGVNKFISKIQNLITLWKFMKNTYDNKSTSCANYNGNKIDTANYFEKNKG
jgi:hypothetical protein